MDGHFAEFSRLVAIAVVVEWPETEINDRGMDISRDDE